MAIASVNPATGETLATFEPHTAQDLEQKLQRSVEAFTVNRRRTFAERAERMLRVAELLEARGMLPAAEPTWDLVAGF